MYKLCFNEAVEQEIKLTTVIGSQEGKGFQKNVYSASLTMLKPLTVWKQQTMENLMRYRYQRTYFLRNLYIGQEETELNVEQLTSSKLKRSMIRVYIVTLII